MNNYRMYGSIDSILAKSIKLEELIKTQSKLFNLNKLDVGDKVALLQHDFNFYSPLIDISEFKSSEKAYAVINSPGKKITDKINLSKDEVSKLKPELCLLVLLKDFDRYISPEAYHNLSRYGKMEIFTNYPEWVILNTGYVPQLTARLLSDLSERTPSFVDKYVKNLSEHATTDYFWINMIKFDEKYEDIFLQNNHRLTTKTDVRQVFFACPGLVKKINNDVIVNSKLSCKEWALLIDNIIRDNKKMFKNWSLSPELIEIFKLDLTAEVLNGKSTSSRVLKSVMGRLFKSETYTT